MNKIAFGDMNDPKRRKIYECMWGSDAFDFPIEKTMSRGSASNNSYTFTNASAVDRDLCGNRLSELFGIKHRNLFKEKFAQSCSGSGQELRRIATLHSSSLCALLFFYNVSKENPYIMEIEGEEYIFTYSCLEYQNTVIKGKNPSNIDVVLVGTDRRSGKPAVFFLESKFSEYYKEQAKRLEIAAAYLKNNYGKTVYRGSSLAKMGLYMIEPDENENFILCSEKACYLEGIKQMISHYIGIRNLCDSPGCKEDIISHAVLAGAKILLGEILFTKGIGQLPIGNGEECFASYRKKYLVLADILNEQLKKDGISDKFTVLSDILSYSLFQDKEFIQEPEVKRFYFELTASPAPD